MTFKQYHTQIKQDERYQKLNFSPDGRDHYVYRVTDYTRTYKQHYYGSHTPPKGKKYKSLMEEFWTYRTSSKKNVLNENAKDKYKVKILKVFDNPAMKMIYESYLHHYFDVKNNDSFWNGSNQTPYSFDTTGVFSWNKGLTKYTHISIFNISVKVKEQCKNRTADYYTKTARCMKGELTPMFNKKHTISTKNKIGQKCKGRYNTFSEEKKRRKLY
jgi:hypothetical protein